MKTPETVKLEAAIRRKYCGPWEYGVHEVTIGIGGDERVDFMTISTKDVVRCFEIKVSHADLHSKAKLSFVGHLNYLVVTPEIADEAMKIPRKTVGILCGESLNMLRRPTKEYLIDEDLSSVKSSLIRSMARELSKCDPQNYNSLVRQLQRERERNWKILGWKMRERKLVLPEEESK